MVSRFCLWLRLSGRHSTGAMRSASEGSTRIASALAKMKRSGRIFASAPKSTMPSAMPVGWFATTIAGPERGTFSSPFTSTWRPIMSASACIAAPAGIGSSASPTRAVFSYWRMR